MSHWSIFLPQRQRIGPANAAKGEVKCPACGRVRHISDMSEVAKHQKTGFNLPGICKICGGRSWTLGWAKTQGI